MRELARLLYINWVLLRHGLDEVILATHLFRPVRFLKYLSPFYWERRGREVPFGLRLRRALEDLGPIFVKFGQILSTRLDLLPPDIAEELIKLQDRVPPFPGDEARRVIEQALGQPVGEIFTEFEQDPLASASIAQVHVARLKSGEEVVVKVLRPGIEKVIKQDVRLLYTLARMAQRYWSDGKRLRPVDVVHEMEKTLLDELDLSREAANATLLRRNFLNSEMLYVPEVYWDHVRQNVLVMERIYGIPVGQVDELKRCGISMKLLGERGVEIFFTQVFRDNFFHADMHPGNIFVEPGGRYISVDFGIMGTLTTEDQRYLAENLLAFFNRDYRRVAELHVQSNWIPKGTRVEEFEAAIRTVSEPIFEKPLSESSIGYFLLRLFQTARRFNMEIQPQLVLLQKTLLNIEGLGRQLYPELDLWTTAKPFMERWIKTQVGPRAFVKRLKDGLPEASEQLPEVPRLAYRVLNDAAEGRLALQWRSAQLDALRDEMREANRRTVGAVGGVGLLLGGIGLGAQAGALPALLTGWGAGVAAIAGLVLLLKALWQSSRS